MTNRPTKNKLRLATSILSIVLVALALILCFKEYLHGGFEVLQAHTLAFRQLIDLLIGLSAGYLLASTFDKKAISQEREDAWQVQDAKLMASITSDKEKQLEAKISTLEAALKNALKKQSPS